MDSDALNMRNWGFYEPSLKGQGHLGLQLMSTIAERDMKQFLPGRDPSAAIINMNGSYPSRDCVVSEAPAPSNYVRDGWLNQREKFLNVLLPNPNYSILSEPSSAPQPLPMVQPPNSSRDEMVSKVEEPPIKKEGKQIKKRKNGDVPRTPKAKKPRKPKSDASTQQVKTAKKMDLVINGIDMDISSIPIPVCSCTGTPHQCYRWGYGGWQSACCTTILSIYPLPMSEKRRGARIAGRKMSQGAFKKVLEKLAAQGYNFGNPIDLRIHWARHGTNKFVTIR